MKTTLVIATMIASPALADFGAAIDSCRTLVDNQSRLACYDGINQPRVTGSHSNWFIESQVSPFTDQTTTTIGTLHAEVLECGRGFRPGLLVRCLEGETNTYIVHGCDAPAPQNYDTLLVDVRWGSEDVESWEFQPSTSNDAFGLWDTSNAEISISEYLLQYDQLAVRFLPDQESRQTMIFNLTGLRAAMEGHGEECGWPELLEESQ